MKSNTQLQKDALDELSWEPGISEKEIVVAVKDGVVAGSRRSQQPGNLVGPP
jgi:hypothetical protein